MTLLPFFTLLFLLIPAPLKMLAILAGGVLFLGVGHHGVVPPDAPGAAHVHEPNPAPAAPLPGNQAAEAKSLEIIVNSDGSYELNGKKLGGPELVEMLKPMATANPELSLEIKADARTPHQMIADAMTLCREAGVEQLSFSSKPSTPQHEP